MLQGTSWMQGLRPMELQLVTPGEHSPPPCMAEDCSQLGMPRPPRIRVAGHAELTTLQKKQVNLSKTQPLPRAQLLPEPSPPRTRPPGHTVAPCSKGLLPLQQVLAAALVLVTQAFRQRRPDRWLLCTPVHQRREPAQGTHTKRTLAPTRPSRALRGR